MTATSNDTVPASPPLALRPIGSGVALGSLPQNSEQELRFVQDRLALLGKITFAISGMFLLVAGVADLAGGRSAMSVAGRVSHLFATLIALALWQGLRLPRKQSPAALQTIDLIGTLGICWSFVYMGMETLQPFGFYTALLSITHVSITRAMIVPSLPRRTLLLCLASFAGLVLMRLALPLAPELRATADPLQGLLEVLLWSIAACAVATVASKVIYGLHEKAREALQLGQYTLEQRIGAGGMGEIYRARHAMLRRPTAVKLLLGDGSEAQLRRFEKEVQQTARLTHPNTISIYDYGRTPEGVFYYAMELLEGMTLEHLVERHGPLPPARVIHFMLQVCGALREAHGIGLIHRDIKPANLFVCRRGDIPDFIKVLDFGLVRQLNNTESIAQSNINVIVGTPLYMSPEALLAPDKVDARSDLYGLGVVAYFLITGAPPFTGNSLIEVCSQHLYNEPTPPSERAAVPQDLERIVLRCLSKNPEQRPQSASELASLLEACADAQSWGANQAENFWANLGEPSEPPRAPLGSGEQRKTLLLADLEGRLGSERAG